MKSMMVLLVACRSDCTDAMIGKVTRLGDQASVTCYSGGVAIFQGRSSGAVHNAENSDGYYFEDASDGKFKEVSGECVVVYD